MLAKQGDEHASPRMLVGLMLLANEAGDYRAALDAANLLLAREAEHVTALQFCRINSRTKVFANRRSLYCCACLTATA